MSTHAGTAGNVSIASTLAGVTVAIVTAYTLPTGISGLVWELEATGCWNTLGSTAAVTGVGRFTVMTSGSASFTTLFVGNNTGLNTTIALPFDLEAAYSTGLSGNSITLNDYSLEILN
jgi:hypothetical protein